MRADAPVDGTEPRKIGSAWWPRAGSTTNWIVTGDTHVLDQARIGIRHLLERVVVPTGCKSQSSGRRARSKRSRSRA
jgi:hypothetical protein